MRRTHALLAMLCFAAPLAAQNISGSEHDLRAKTASGIQDYGQICVYCHTPHNATTTSLALWNRSVSGLGPYTMYYSSGAGHDASPNTASISCLSCHDGSVALDLIVNKPTGGGASLGGKITGTALIGTTLTNDHPISVAYPATGDFKASPANVKLFSNKVECASCHNPHSTTNGSFLITSNSASALCLACHNR